MFSHTMTCTAAYIAGVLVSSNISLSALLIFACGIILAGAFRAIRHKRTNAAVFLAALFLAFGGIRYFFAAENSLYEKFPDKFITVTGNISSTPMKANGTYKYRYTLSADTIEYLGETYSFRGKIRLSAKNRLEYGERIRASGFLKDLPDKSNETDFDSKAYYKSMGIKARLAAYELARINGEQNFSPVGKLKSRIFDGISENYDGDDAAYLYALTLGDRTWFSADCKNSLLRTGVLHSVYSPYIHVMLIFAFIGAIFANADKKTRDFAVLSMLMLYTLYNSESPVILKTAVPAAAVILCQKLFGYADKREILAVFLLLMTLADPFLCFNGGFVMSVAATLSVYAIYEPLKERFKPASHTLNFKTRAFHSSLLWLSIAVGTLPVGAYYFSGISLYSAVLPILFVPCTAVIAVLSPILFAIRGAYAALPFCAELLDSALAFIEAVPGKIELLPFSRIILAKPQITQILLYYVILAIFVRALTGKLKTEGTKVLSAFASAFILCLALDFSVNSLDIYFVNVGQGDGAVLNTYAGETVLIDGGGASNYQEDYNLGEAVYLPYLTAHGFSHADTAIVTHFHKDHAEGIVAATENLRIKTLAMPDTDPQNPYRQKLEQIARERGIEIMYLSAGDELSYKSGLKIKILAPDSEQLSGDDENDTSIVAEVHYGEFTALFTGDSGDEADDTYAENIDLLKVAHHGSETANSVEFIKHTNPEYAVISVGKNNEYGLPSKKVLGRYYAAGTEVLRTDILGDIHFKVGKTGNIKYSSFHGE